MPELSTLTSSLSAVKSIGDGLFEFCLYKFTSADRPDLTNEYFDDSTDFMEANYPFTAKLMYHHGLDPEIGVVPIGEIVSAERRHGDGIYAKARIDFITPYTSYVKSLNQPDAWKAKQLELAAQYDSMLKDLGIKGILAASGGALPQGVVVDDNGHIKRWPTIEASATYSPAEPIYTKLTPVKSLPVTSLRELATVREGGAGVDKNNDSINENENSKGQKNMDMDALKQAISDVILPLIAALKGSDSGVNADDAMASVEAQAVDDMGKNPDEMKSLTVEQVEKRVTELAQKAIQAAVQKAVEKQNKANALVAKSVADAKKTSDDNGRKSVVGFSSDSDTAHKSSNISVSESLKYSHLSAQDMLLAHEIAMAGVPDVLRKQTKSSQLFSDEFLKHMVAKTLKMVDSHKYSNPVDQLYIKSIMKANEVDTTANTGFGPEWVGATYSTQIWDKARVQPIWQALESKGMRTMEVPQGSSTLNIQTEGTDPTVFSYPQSADLDSTGHPSVNLLITPFATGTVPLTPGALGLASAYSMIEDEDSVIPIAQQLNYQTDMKMNETVEQVIFNGDTATGANTNVNLIDGTPATGTSRPYYLASNGMLKYPLVTNTALSRSAGGSLALDDYRKTIALIAPQFQTRLNNLLWIMDPYVQVTSMGLPELATDDVRNRYATITSGIIRNLFGIDAVQSGFILKSNVAGKVPAAGGTLGRFLLAYAPYWVLGWKRHIKVEYGYDPLTQTRVVVSTMRMGLVNRGADACALTYNIGLS